MTSKLVVSFCLATALVLTGGCRRNHAELGGAEQAVTQSEATAQESEATKKAAENQKHRDNAVRDMRSRFDGLRKIEWDAEVKNRAFCDLDLRWGQSEYLYRALGDTNRELKEKGLSELTAIELGFDNEEAFNTFVPALADQYLDALVKVFNKGGVECDGRMDRYTVMQKIEQVLADKDQDYLKAHNLPPAKVRQMWLTAFRSLVPVWRSSEKGGEADMSGAIAEAMGTYNFTPAELGLTAAEAKKLLEATEGS